MTTSTTSTTATTATTTAAPKQPSADRYDKRPSAAVKAANAAVQQSVVEIAAHAQAAIAATAVIKTELRAEIDTLLHTNTGTLSRLRADNDTLQYKVDNLTNGDVWGARLANFGNNGWDAVDWLKHNAGKAADAVRDLEVQMTSWTSSITSVEAEVAGLEQHALVLATPAPPAANVAALRAHASTIGSLTALEHNLERQVTLLTDLRDSGAVLSASLTGHLSTVEGLLKDTQAIKAHTMALLQALVGVMAAPNPTAAAEDYLKKQISEKVQTLLHDAGVTPDAFADRLLDGKDAITVSLLRPRLVAAFTAAMPPVFSTGDVFGG